MGPIGLVVSTVGRCLDAACLLLDLHFLVVHALVRTVVAVLTFAVHLPGLAVTSLAALGDLVLAGLVSLEGGLEGLLGGLLEGLKMAGYLGAHVALRGREQLCRGGLWLLEGAGVALSLVLYLASALVHLAQSAWAAAAGLLHALACPLQKALELSLAALACLHGGLGAAAALLWSPCRALLDFAVSLVHVFVSVFLLNVYGLLLTAAIALTATAYLNPELTRQAALRVAARVDSCAAARRLCALLRALARAASRFLRAASRHLHAASHFLHAASRHLPRAARQLYLLERRLWEHLSRLGSQLSRARGPRHRPDPRAHGDGDPGDQRRDPPDGRAGEPASSSGGGGGGRREQQQQSPKAAPAEDLLSLLKEQEDRKKCVICQDSNKTVVLLPCRHLCLCRGCTRILLRQPLHQQNCPLCRHMILNTMDVYL